MANLFSRNPIAIFATAESEIKYRMSPAPTSKKWMKEWAFQSAVLERLATSLIRQWQPPHASTCQRCQPSALKAIQPVVLGAITTAPSHPIIFDSDPLFVVLDAVLAVPQP
ncbi:hypothetical protein EDB89DRAFT_1911473 [Lactarius sanguifluus]|nr:hypothetical protein EDB89DRAFT_1911473 [Lactarius sanguifluus]